MCVDVKGLRQGWDRAAGLSARMWSPCAPNTWHRQQPRHAEASCAVCRMGQEEWVTVPWQRLRSWLVPPKNSLGCPNVCALFGAFIGILPTAWLIGTFPKATWPFPWPVGSLWALCLRWGELGVWAVLLLINARGCPLPLESTKSLQSLHAPPRLLPPYPTVSVVLTPRIKRCYFCFSYKDAQVTFSNVSGRQTPQHGEVWNS